MCDPIERTKYIAFLRGVNVGGHVVKMNYLRTLFSELGLVHVRSYIQTGNIFFERMEADRVALTQQLEQRLQEALEFEVPVFLRTINEVEQTVQLNPFKDVEATPDTRHLIIFVSEPLPPDLELPVQSPKNDFELLEYTPGEVFAVLRIINGRVANPVAFIEKTFKVRATARFFGTTIKILHAAKSG